MEPQQGTPEWHLQRAGRLTASMFGAAAGINPYQSRNEALQSKLGRRSEMTGNGAEACAWGTKHEPVARMAYEARSGNICGLQRGCVPHPTYPQLAGSPDGLVGNEGVIEIKCPFYSKEPHVRIPMHYYCQINGLMEIFNREWCDFISWTPSSMRIFRCYRDPELFNYLLPKYLSFVVCMQKQLDRMPNMERGEKAAITKHIQDSMDAKIDYAFYQHLEPAYPLFDDEQSSEEEQVVVGATGPTAEALDRLDDLPGIQFESFLSLIDERPAKIPKCE